VKLSVLSEAGRDDGVPRKGKGRDVLPFFFGKSLSGLSADRRGAGLFVRAGNFVSLYGTLF